MKIAHIMPGFPIEYPGGITNYVKTLIESQIKAGEKIVLVSESTESCFDSKNVTIISVTSESPGNFSHKIPRKNKTSDNLYQTLLSEGVDIAHFHTVFGLSENTLNDFSAGLLPYIISLHDYYIACPRVFMMDKWGGVCRSIQRSKCSRCVGTLDNILTMRKIARKFNFVLPSIRSDAIYKRDSVFSAFMNNAKLGLAVSSRVTALFAQAFPEARLRTYHIGNKSASDSIPVKSQSERIRVTYLGTFSRHKGGELFLELVNYCQSKRSDIDFTFYGKLEKPYDTLVPRYPIQIGGRYTPSDIPKIMSETDIGVAMPIWEDNGPQVVMEMVNYGTPVLATSVGGIPDFIPEGGGFLFDPDNQQARLEAYKWIAEMTKSKIAQYTSRLVKLKSPELHQREIADVYKTFVTSPASSGNF